MKHSATDDSFDRRLATPRLLETVVDPGGTIYELEDAGRGILVGRRDCIVASLR